MPSRVSNVAVEAARVWRDASASSGRYLPFFGTIHAAPVAGVP
jgi:hypothetical protein